MGETVAKKTRHGMGKPGSRQFAVRLQERDQEGLAVVRGYLSPHEPGLIDESEVVRYCIRVAAETIAARVKQKGAG